MWVYLGPASGFGPSRIGSDGPRFTKIKATSDDTPMEGSIYGIAIGAETETVFQAGISYSILFEMGAYVDSGSGYRLTAVTPDKIYKTAKPFSAAIPATYFSPDGAFYNNAPWSAVKNYKWEEIEPGSVRVSFDCVEQFTDQKTWEYSFDSPISATFNNCETTSGNSEYWLIGNGVITIADGQDPTELLEAINKQTEDMNNNHQETMDKIDDVTDFDEQEQSGMTGQVDDVKSQLDEKLGILSFADTVIGNFIGLFKETSEKPGLVFPGFDIQVDGATYTVWEDTTFDLSIIDTGFADLMAAVRFATSFLVYAALFMYVQKIFSAIMQDWSDRSG